MSENNLIIGQDPHPTVPELSVDRARGQERLVPLSPRVEMTTRVATMDDLPFIDALQKQHHKQLGFFPRAQMEGYIRNQWVLLAEGQAAGGKGQVNSDSSLAPVPSPLAPMPLGYCASRDRYQKRDELGAIFQLCVVSGAQRKLIGAMLLKAVFERAPYGCKLFCCWCAQDIEANRFWESMGFVPLAFRTGSAKKSRTHIFWQRRIRAGDTETPWWFPSQTGGGSIREDRLVLPIPPGMHWSDEMPRILPGEGQGASSTGSGQASGEGQVKKLPGPRRKVSSLTSDIRSLTSITNGGMRFEVPNAGKSETKPKREPKPKAKNDPKLVAAARELRDRWLEEVNSGKYLPQAAGKYEVSRILQARESNQSQLLIESKSLAA